MKTSPTYNKSLTVILCLFFLCLTSASTLATNCGDKSGGDGKYNLCTGNTLTHNTGFSIKINSINGNNVKFTINTTKEIEYSFSYFTAFKQFSFNDADYVLLYRNNIDEVAELEVKKVQKSDSPLGVGMSIKQGSGFENNVSFTCNIFGGSQPHTLEFKAGDRSVTSIMYDMYFERALSFKEPGQYKASCKVTDANGQIAYKSQKFNVDIVQNITLNNGDGTYRLKPRDKVAHPDGFYMEVLGTGLEYVKFKLRKTTDNNLIANNLILRPNESTTMTIGQLKYTFTYIGWDFSHARVQIKSTKPEITIRYIESTTDERSPGELFYVNSRIETQDNNVLDMSFDTDIKCEVMNSSGAVVTPAFTGQYDSEKEIWKCLVKAPPYPDQFNIKLTVQGIGFAAEDDGYSFHTVQKNKENKNKNTDSNKEYTKKNQQESKQHEVIYDNNIENEPKNKCTGCMFNNVCYKKASKLIESNIERYCDPLSGHFIPVKKDREYCQNNFECESSLCKNKECKSSKGLVHQFVNWITALF